MRLRRTARAGRPSRSTVVGGGSGSGGGAGPALIGASTFVKNGPSPSAYALPVCAVGEYRIIHLLILNTSGTPINPAGWTVLLSTDYFGGAYPMYTRVYGRVKQGGDGDTVTLTTGTNGMTYPAMTAYAFSGVNAASPVEASIAFQRDVANPLDLTAATVTTTNPNTLVLESLMGINLATTPAVSAPSTGTELNRQSTSGGASTLTSFNASTPGVYGGSRWTAPDGSGVMELHAVTLGLRI